MRMCFESYAICEMVFFLRISLYWLSSINLGLMEQVVVFCFDCLFAFFCSNFIGQCYGNFLIQSRFVLAVKKIVPSILQYHLYQQEQFIMWLFGKCFFFGICFFTSLFDILGILLFFFFEDGWWCGGVSCICVGMEMSCPFFLEM